MRVLIVEDESLAVTRIKGLLEKYEKKTEIVGELHSVKSVVNWFKENSAPDVILMDIHLEDGLSFQSFEEVQIDTPIIFTTAYDEYLINAFRYNGVDYLLKPVEFGELSASLEKFQKYHHQPALGLAEVCQLLRNSLTGQNVYKERFLIAYGTKMKSISVKDIAYFYYEDRITFLVSHDNQRYTVDFSLEKLSTILNPKLFFRINRQFMVNISCIAQIKKYSTTRLKLVINPEPHVEVFVSIDKYGKFKEWLDT